MADTAQDQQNQQGQQTTQQTSGQVGQQGYQQGQPDRSQENWDQQFVSQMTGGIDAHSLETSRELAQSYFRLAEDTLATARRVSEAQMLHLYRQQIITEVASQVIPQVTQRVAQQFKQHPEWLKTS